MTPSCLRIYVYRLPSVEFVYRHKRKKGKGKHVYSLSNKLYMVLSVPINLYSIRIIFNLKSPVSLHSIHLSAWPKPRGPLSLFMVPAMQLNYQFRGVVRKQVSRAETNNYIPQYMLDAITCPCPWYLFFIETTACVSPQSYIIPVPVWNAIWVTDWLTK